MGELKLNYDFLIVEDNKRSADRLMGFLDLKDYFKNINHVERENDALKLIISKSPPKVYCVDMNLGLGNFEGISVLKSIKNNCPEALILVYSAFTKEVRKDCELIGLDKIYFIDKDPGNTVANIKFMKDTIVKYIEVNDAGTDVLMANIKHINRQENWFKADCQTKNSTSEKYFNLKEVEDSLDEALKIEDELFIKINKLYPGYKISFEKTDKKKDQKDTINSFSKIKIDLKKGDMLDDGFWSYKKESDD